MKRSCAGWKPMREYDLSVSNKHHIHDECGVFGVFSPRRQDLPRLVYYGLFALQHRGQESAGIVINDDGVFSDCRDTGLVNEVFTPSALEKLGQGSPGEVYRIRQTREYAMKVVRWEKSDRGRCFQ